MYERVGRGQVMPGLAHSGMSRKPSTGMTAQVSSRTLDGAVTAQVSSSAASSCTAHGSHVGRLGNFRAGTFPNSLFEPTDNTCTHTHVVRHESEH